MNSEKESEAIKLKRLKIQKNFSLILYKLDAWVFN
jgi:hypothetical protein